MDLRDRRTFLRLIGVTGISSVTGCSSLIDSSSEEASNKDNTTDPITIESKYANVRSEPNITIEVHNSDLVSGDNNPILRYLKPSEFNKHGEVEFEHLEGARYQATIPTMPFVTGTQFSIRSPDGSVLTEDMIFVRPVTIITDNLLAFHYGTGIDSNVTSDEIGQFVAGEGLEKTLQTGAKSILTKLGEKYGFAGATAGAIASKFIALAMLINDFAPNANPPTTIAAHGVRKSAKDEQKVEITDSIEVTRNEDFYPAINVFQGTEYANSVSLDIVSENRDEKVNSKSYHWPDSLQQLGKYVIIPRTPLTLGTVSSLEANEKRTFLLKPTFRRTGEPLKIRQIPSSEENKTGKPPERNSPEALVRAFLQAQIEGDEQAAKEMVHESLRDDATNYRWWNENEGGMDITINNVENMSVTELAQDIRGSNPLEEIKEASERKVANAGADGYTWVKVDITDEDGDKLEGGALLLNDDDMWYFYTLDF